MFVVVIVYFLHHVLECWMRIYNSIVCCFILIQQKLKPTEGGGRLTQLDTWITSCRWHVVGMFCQVEGINPYRVPRWVRAFKQSCFIRNLCSGTHAGDECFLPRINFSTTSCTKTISNSTCFRNHDKQSSRAKFKTSRDGIYLRKPVFSHGQLLASLIQRRSLLLLQTDLEL